MHIRNISFQLLFTLCLLVISSAVFAQQNHTVQLSGSKMRAPLSLPKGASTIQICGLEPGNSYKVIASPMAYGQDAEIELAPASVLSKGVSQFAYMREKKNGVRFAAPNPCVELQVNVKSRESGKEVPMFLSIKCETCPEANAWLHKITGMAEQSVLEVEGGYSAQELVENVLVGGGCFQISNVQYEGQGEQIGIFSNGLSSLGINTGVIMATGNIEIAPGPNNSDGQSQGFGNETPDSDLESLTVGEINDLCNIEFDFVPTQSMVSFEFIFASEEYCEYVNSTYNDVFGFFISGPGIVGTQNIAVIPNTATPVTISNVNHMVNSLWYAHNTPAGGDNCEDGGPGIPPPTPVTPASGPGVNELEYDGFTKKMTAIANVIPCQTYHIKLKIADVGDGVWDSAVFLRANSFNAGGEVLATPAYPGGSGSASAYENCDAGSIRFKRGNNDNSQPLIINFAVAGSATPGLDYVPLVSPVTIPAGQTEILVPIQVLPDLLAEGQENIKILIPNACSCTQGTVDFVIKDQPSLSVSGSDQFLCIGENASLQAAVSGGIPNPALNYNWSTGQTTALISPDIPGTYTVTVSDGCSVTASTSIQLAFNDCGCDAETFIKTIGLTDQIVRGYGVYDSQDGNLYLTGLKQDSATIIKITPTGTVLWMRTFDVISGVNDNISELLIDSEGFLVGCGQSGDFQPGINGFIFRYNPVSNTMQWLNTYGLESPYVMGLVELANGNYLVYDNPHQPSNDNRMLEFTRSDGIIDAASPLSQRLNLGGGDNFNSSLIHNGKLYGVGRYTNGADFGNMRHALSQIDLATGNVDWSRLSHVSPDLNARIYGMDLIVENQHLISTSFGSDIDASLADTRIFLQKTTLDGDIVWVKRFDVLEVMGEVVDEIISVPDGFILYGRGANAPSDLYLIKTDKDGVLKWSKKIDYGFNDYVGAVSTFQSQILLKDNHLFFMASTDGPTISQMLMVKTTLDGTVEGNCNFIQPTPVETSEVLNPFNFAVDLAKSNFIEETGAVILTPRSTQLSIENQCKVVVEEQVNIVLCPGEFVTIDSVEYAQDTTIQITIEGPGGCDTLRTYTIQTQPYPTRSEALSFCAGNSVTLGGQVYTESGIVIDTLPATVGCDTIVTYTLSLLPYQTRSEAISFCPGSSVNIGGQVYTQSGVVVDTLPGTIGCDTIVTYTLSLLPYQTRSEAISFCPGSSVNIGGQVYTQSGTVIDTLAGGAGCDTIVTYTLSLVAQPTLTQTIQFCPGETITLGGVTYTQPAVVVLTLPSNTDACDTIATYQLQFSTPAPSVVGITCPQAITIGVAGGSTGAEVTYNDPTATSDCTCPGIALNMTSGLPSGSMFPPGITNVCYQAKDSCGQTATCCFKVTLEEDDPCDIKINGCIKYELLTITEDAGKNRTYRIRVTNNCSNKLIYTAIQIPDGLVAIEPANFSTYTAPSGNTYVVRSPNFSPQYSVRYSSVGDSIQNGESDIFKYTIPAQANNVLFIHVVSRLAPYVYVAAHLNTFYCPIGITPTDDRPIVEREDLTASQKLSDLDSALTLFPNPTSGELFADLSLWSGQQLQVQVLDGRGQLVQQSTVLANEAVQAFELPSGLSGGIYFMEVLTERGEKFMGRFVVVR